MARNIIGIVTGLAVWLLIAALAGIILREMWPAYASVADALVFTLPMLIARLAIGAVASVATGFVTACITRSVLAIGFIPVHVMLWNKFPLWYHLWFLLSLIPLTYLGNATARGAPARPPTVAAS
jgi:hypothetical protein